MSRPLVAVVALSLTAAGLGMPAASATPSSCSAVSTNWTARTTPHAAPESLLNAYSNSGKGWTGADSTYSVALPGRRTAWIFSDTFLGPVNPDGSRPTTAPFINNSFVIQQGKSLKTVTGGTATKPTALIPPPSDGWYWIGAAQTSHAGRDLDVTALRFVRTGTGQWDWHWASNYLARFDTKTFKLKSLTPLPSAANVQWSGWLLRDRGYTYIYGVEDLGSSKYQHVARVRGDDLTAKPWEYWTGSGWSSDESASVRVLEGVANEHSVTQFKDGYLLVTHDTKELFSKRVIGYFSCSPTGPWVNPVELYQAPETSGNIITYNSHEHPELRRGNELLVSYNVNSLVSDDLYGDVSIYRPRFLAVTLAAAK
ncbi:DUF4185 domain-containing protein [Kribbella jiaozuonensis]|uniref:DUF4185 domain-containing protein n=1 Tax=Kribbella jiaozuonensis TaxID=2575441 RepID=A0A4U3LQG9_9ACTN|nr:DUF4185 domain-containing protein [Kribbella jiaozuonensis]TKK77942.1 DUF4185 domain-containing protein [Kribbella jiaozuonensis]